MSFSINVSLDENIKNLFDTTENNKNIYDTVKLYLIHHNEITLNKLPMFYKLFLKDPYKFKDFLDIIFEASLQSNNIIYEDVNIITLMCCAVFHITKLYIMLNRVHTDYEHVLKNAANFFHLPLATWLYNIITNYNQDDIQQFVIQKSKKKFYNSFQYLLLMSYVSNELYIKDRPLFKYLDAINKIFTKDNDEEYPKLFDPIDDILLILVLDNNSNNKDLYDFHFKLQYILTDNRVDITHNEIIHYRYLVEKHTELYFDSIFINGAYNIRNFIIDRMDTKLCFHKYYQTCISARTFPIYIMYEMIFELCDTYKVISSISHYCEIEIDNSWLYLTTKLYMFLLHSEDLEFDFTFFIHSLGGHITYNHFFTHDAIFRRNESILFAIIKNTYFEKNASFIRKFLKAILKKDFSTFSKYMMRKMKSIAELSSNDTTLIYQKNENNQDILILLLERLFVKNTLTKSIQLASFIQNGRQALKSFSFDNEELKMFFKEIIQELLERSTNMNNPEYITLLYQYEDALKDLGINLNMYNTRFSSLLARKLVCCICICKGFD